MASPTSYEDSPSATKPVPIPTNPVAQQPVDTDAPEFDWTPIPDADHYRLQIAATDDFETIHYDESVERKTQIPLDEVLPTGSLTGCWRVRANTPNGPTPWSETARFSTAAPTEETQGSLVVNASPVPLHPTEETSANQNATTFAWESIPEATGYEIQVARDRSFSDPDVDLTLDQVTALTLYKTLPKEARSLYWRVRSLFPHSTSGPWSEPVVFELSPAPAPETEPSSEPDATESTSPQASPMAAGPAQHSKTSSTLSLTVALVAIVSFLVTILLIALLG